MTRTMEGKQRALVLFSGGQDSTTCLAWALARFARVDTLGFDYGQRNKIELACRTMILRKIRANFPPWAKRLGTDYTIDLSALGEIAQTALTDSTPIKTGDDGLPNTFVPGRNLIFLSFAAAIAHRDGIACLVGGMSQTDYSGYPDCRDATVKAIGRAMRLAMDSDVRVRTPLMWIDKAATWTLAEALGGREFVDLIIEYSHSCYLGDRVARHSWGYGCAECPACQLRAQGYDRYMRASTAPGKTLRSEDSEK